MQRRIRDQWRAELESKFDVDLQTHARLHDSHVQRRSRRTPWSRSHWLSEARGPVAHRRSQPAPQSPNRQPADPLPNRPSRDVKADDTKVRGRYPKWFVLVPTNYEQWARKGQLNPPPTPPEHCSTKKRSLPVLSWSDSRRSRNRLAHASNGNTPTSTVSMGAGHCGRELPGFEWSDSRRSRNRRAHAANGNTTTPTANADAGSGGRELTPQELATISANRQAALALRAARDQATAETARRELTQDQLAAIQANRLDALARRAMRMRFPGLHIPPAPRGFNPPAPPPRPQNFLQWHAPDIAVTLLQDVNPHPRDDRVRFDAGPHMYFVDGVPTMGSVTGLLHRFAEDFDAPTVIQGMMNSWNWCALLAPGPIYEQSTESQRVQCVMRAGAWESQTIQQG